MRGTPTGIVFSMCAIEPGQSTSPRGAWTHNELVAGEQCARAESSSPGCPCRQSDCDQCAATNQLPALAGDGDVGIGHGVGPRLDGMFRTARGASLDSARPVPPLGGPSPSGLGGFPVAGPGLRKEACRVPGWRRIAMRMKVRAAGRRCRSRGSWRVPLYEVRNPINLQTGQVIGWACP